MTERKLDLYREAQEPLPRTMLRWHLYGAGLDNLGRDSKPEIVELPPFGPDELLVRQDACGLCFSDTKVIGLGPNHPRMTGRDLATDPVTLGHEVACTVVGVGANLAEKYHIGERFVVQADVFYQGKSMAYGYAISGGLAEYSVIPKAILNGDEGCYLLPIRPDTGYVESALTEPWACVVSAYAQSHRSGIKPDGLMLVVAQEDGSAHGYDWSRAITEQSKPKKLYVLGVGGAALQGLLSISDDLGIPIETVGKLDMASLQDDLTAAKGFDDIIVLGSVEPDVIERVAPGLADHGILNLVGDTTLSRKVSLDIGRIHYNWHYYLGTTTHDPADAYFESRTSDLLSGGATWMIGAGGPMGQMHVQRAVQHAYPPRVIVATDVDDVRLQSVIDRFGSMAQARGIELVAINPNTLSQEEFDARLREVSGGGFSDIVSMVPVASLIEHAANFLADGGWFNIFAGVARGTMAQLDVNRIIHNGARFLGSSGSSLSDMRETLRRVESDELSTNASLAAIGGMAAAKEGLQAVKEGWYPGKTLIFPHIHDLPLTPLPELKDKYPSVYAKMKDGQFWTQEAEQELLRLLL